MLLNRSGSEVFAPDRTPESQALARTTHLGIGAHPDDLEFMTWHGILECLHRRDRWFSGVTVTDGRGSSRCAVYADFSDDQMARVRRDEQHKAAVIGEYGALVTLGYSSAELRGPARREVGEDLDTLLRATRPRVLYTHSLCDRHASHVAVATLVVAALRRLGPEYHPREFYGCEVWRSLDWLMPEDRVDFDVSAHENLTAALTGVYDSQIAGGKRYDLATSGRRRANATYHDAYAPDQVTLMEHAMDLGPLLRDPSLSMVDFALGMVDRLAVDVRQRLQDFGD
jgi:LmbE family N-acetylglucosaminyl deacetylase